jgi:hypothetical protein
LLSTASGVPAPVVEVLVRHLGDTHDDSVRELLVRALGASAVPFEGELLARLFEVTDSVSLRYAVANTFAQGRATGVANWVLQAVKQSEMGAARQPLALAVARLANRADATRVLVGLLDEMPGHAAIALAECGQEEDIRALEAAYARVHGWERVEIGRAISVIKRRMGASQAS